MRYCNPLSMTLLHLVKRNCLGICLVVVTIAILCGNVSYAEKGAIVITNEMIYQKLLEIEKRQAVFEERFNQIDKRFEQIEKRITEFREDTNRRFIELRDDMNKRFEQLFTFLWILTGIFTTLVVTVIGFAWWDRRTVIRRARDEAVDEVERKLFAKLLSTLRYLAKEDSKLAEALKLHGLL